MRQLFFIFILALGACTTRPDVSGVALQNLKEEAAHIEPSNNQLTVIYFLSPECPLCINYTLAMRNLEEEFSSREIRFFGVFAKEWFSSTEVRDFAAKYKLEFEMLFDDGNELARVLGATVTPEVFVLNERSEVLYAGKIDNWINDLGKKKLEVSDHYLQNAIIAWRDGTPINPTRTTPIGCLIE